MSSNNDALQAACQFVSVAWPLSPDQVLRLYNEVGTAMQHLSPKKSEPAGAELSEQAKGHAISLRQCALFASDAGTHIAKSMTDAADFLDSLSCPVADKPDNAEGLSLSPDGLVRLDSRYDDIGLQEYEDGRYVSYENATKLLAARDATILSIIQHPIGSPEHFRAVEDARLALGNPEAALSENEKLVQRVQKAEAKLAAATADSELLDALQHESWDLRCFDIPTGGGDAEIGWRVVGHWQAKPHERTVAEVFSDNPRAAIRAALEVKP